MKFSKEEKTEFLKAFTKIIKDSTGRGPKNIYIKYFEDEIHIVVQGIVSDFEKHLIRNFNEEAIITLTNFYERYANKCGDIFTNLLKGEYNFKLNGLDSNFLKDEFIYKLKIEEICEIHSKTI